MGPYFLILQRAVLADRWRGYGLGPLIAGTALNRLDAGCSFAALVAAPVTGDTDGPGRAVAVEKLGRVWKVLGFEPVEPGSEVRVVDLIMSHFQEALAAERSRISTA